MRKFLIVAAAVAIVVWYLKRKPSEPVTVSGNAAPMAVGPGCLSEVENANRLLTDAARVLASMPVNESAWNDAENRTTQAISRAESACSGGDTEAERAGLADARDALYAIKTTLSEAATAARGGGGFQGAVRQEQIDRRIDSARRKLGLQ